MASVIQPTAERLLLYDISWQAYEALLATWQDRPLRLTYDNGSLEIMSPLLIHEKLGRLVCRFIDVFTEEQNIAVASGGATTFKQEARRRGLEPDGSYWIQHEAAMRGKDVFDPDHDPPPDLAIEVDITHSSLDRMSIYAALGVAEVWRFDEEGMTIQLLQQGGYAAGEVSLALPGLPPAELVRFLEMRREMDETSLVRAFRTWVRTQMRKARRPRKKK